MSLSLIDIIYTSIKLLLYLEFLTQLSQIYFFVESINIIKCRLVIVCRLKKTMQNYVQYRYHRYSWNVSYNFIEFFLHQIRYHINVRDDAYRFTRFSYKQKPAILTVQMQMRIHVMKFLILIYMPIKLCRGLIILGQMIKILKMINVLMENDIEM